MENVEKKLIKDLFLRLQKAEKKNIIRDIEAEKLIIKIFKKQPNSLYYMTQTILIQETAIQKLHNNIEELKKILKEKEEKINSNNKSSGFLSNFLGLGSAKNSNLYDKNKNINSNPYSSQTNSTNNSIPVQEKVSNSFLGNALQTAVGVAGGIVTANMLMNLFNHNKSSSENLNSNFDSANNLFQENSENIVTNNYIINEEENISSFDEDIENTELSESIVSDDNDDYV